MLIWVGCLNEEISGCCVNKVTRILPPPASGKLYADTIVNYFLPTPNDLMKTNQAPFYNL